MNKRTTFAFLLTGIMAVSCQGYERASAYQPESGAFSHHDTRSLLVTESDGDNYFGNDEIISEQKLIWTAGMTLETKAPDELPERIDSISVKYQGYISNRSLNFMTLRIPQESMESAIEDLGTLGKVISLNQSAQDVTFQYNDLEIRLENAERARQTYLQLLEEAKNVSEALLVEKELERLNTEIDHLKGLINGYNNQINYSTINVNIREKTRLGILGYVGKGLWTGVKWLFVRN